MASKMRMYYVDCGGLQAVHKSGFVHGDFHPGNILFINHLNRGHTTLVYQGGLTKMCRMMKFMVWFHNPYIAPEVLHGKPYTQAADIYSFGMILYEIITEKKPFIEHDHEAKEFFKEYSALDNTGLIFDIAKGIRPKIGTLTPKCISEIIQQCRDEDSEKRPQVAEFIPKLKRFIFT